MRRFLPFLPVVLFLAGADGPAAEKLAGTWTVASMIYDGKPLAEEVFRDRKMVIDDTTITAVVGGEKKRVLTYQLDAAKSPKQIDLARSDNTDRARGIYALEGDTLELCYGPPGRERPGEFASAEGSKVYLIVLKREKR